MRAWRKTAVIAAAAVLAVGGATFAATAAERPADRAPKAGQAGSTGEKADPVQEADQAALDFTTKTLGFTEIDRVIDHEVGDQLAYVKVGYAEGTAAELVLERNDPETGWQVTGTKDGDFSISSPAAGTKVSSPLKVEGKISGVDESIVLEVRQASDGASLGKSDGVPAGGENSPWSSSVEFSGGSGALWVVASTGGHVQNVERFTLKSVTAG